MIQTLCLRTRFQGTDFIIGILLISKYSQMKILAFRTKLACLEPEVPISFLHSKCQIQPRISPLSLPSQPFKVSLSILKR